MPVGRFGSFVVGFLSPIALTVLGRVIGQACDVPIPIWQDLDVPSRGAWLWTPKTSAFTPVPYQHPMREPGLRIGSDESAWVRSAEVGADERFDGTRFVDAEERFIGSPSPTYVGFLERPAEANNETKVPVADGTWLAQSNEETARTWISSGKEWKRAPTLPPGYSAHDTAAYAGDRLVVLCGDRRMLANSNSPGWIDSVCVARLGDASFHSIPVPSFGSSPGGQRLLVGAGDAHVLAVGQWPSSSAGVVARLVDIDSGAVSSPALSGQLAAKGLTSLSTVMLPDGRALLAPAGPRTDRGFDPSPWKLAILSLFVLALAVLEQRLLRGRLTVVWAVVGAVIGAVLAGFGAVVVYVIDHMHLQL